LPVQQLKALFISCTSCKAGSVVKSRNHKEKVKSYIMGTLRNAFQVRFAQSCAPLRRMINYVKFAPLLVSVVLVTALASGLQWFTPSLRKRSAQHHPTRTDCTCSSLAPLSPLPSTQPHAGHPCAAVPPALLVRLRRTRGSAALVCRLPAGAGGGVPRFQPSARSASASGSSRLER
jgi:hypothetical protein